MSLPLRDALDNYKTACVELNEAEQMLPEHILEVLLTRDHLQYLLSKDNPNNTTLLIMLFRLDEQLKQYAQRIRNTVDLEQWRASIHPQKEAWWWFLDEVAVASKKESAIARYEAAVTSLEHIKPQKIQADVEQWVVEDFSGVFNLRDVVQAEIDDGDVSPENGAIVASLDQRLRQRIEHFPQLLDSRTLVAVIDRFDEMRDVLKPSEQAWWWFLKIPAHWWDRYDSVWVVLTVFWLTGTFGLLTDISTRFLGGGGPGTFGAIAIIFQSVLALMGGGAVTQKGNSIVERNLARWRVPKRLWQEVKFAGATVLLLTFVGFRLLLPGISNVYVNRGSENYVAGRLDSAEAQYLRAISLNPDNILAHYSLGAVYERLGDEEGAREKYKLAIAGGVDLAYKKLAKLEILAQNYTIASDLLLEGIPFARDEVAEYEMLTNLGWARFELERYKEARERLETAIELEQSLDQKYWLMAPHCLMAKTLEKLNEEQAALKFWQNCIDVKHSRGVNNPEEDKWIYEAKQRLNLL